MRIVFSLVAGALFGLGLIISGMTDTKKVQGWLDIFGEWDPTLAFVMGGAILPMAIAWKVARVRTPLRTDKFPVVNSAGIDRDLIIGSVFFGVGWGLAGLCPGPAIASLSFGGSSGVVFASTMIIGMLSTRRLQAFFLKVDNTIETLT
ncbi:hypothetical protein N9C22_06220 [Paracoccaceae bacterium]|nr:hypothetical protein [Paracoccaceae bacterium]